MDVSDFFCTFAAILILGNNKVFVMNNYYNQNISTVANYPQLVFSADDEPHFPSEGLFLGSLRGGAAELPALLDLDAIKGFCVLYNDAVHRTKANRLLERLAWRLALVVPSHLCDILLYSGGNPGEVFSTHAYMHKYVVGEREQRVQFDGSREEFDALIDAIYCSISDRMSMIRLAGKQSLVELNDSLGKDARLKYQFVVLSDFPRHQSLQSMYKLSQIIEVGTKAGVYVLMSWDMNDPFEELQRQQTTLFSPQQMLQQMELLVPKNDGFVFRNSGHDELFNRFVFRIDDQTISASDMAAWSEHLNLMAERAKKNARPKTIIQDFDTLMQTPYEPVMSEMAVTVGLDLKDKHPVTVRFNSKDYLHTFILGQSGSGKSVLLNNIICSAILKYSPEDLMLYLLDFKGVEFNRYKGLKHTKAVLVDNSDPQMTLEVLRELADENKARVKLWKKEGVSNIDGYNKKYPNKRMPQILFIADECQVLFKSYVTSSSERRIQQEISEILNTIATQGRSQGIHMLLATQQLDETDISGQILKNLTECFLLMSAPSDSEKLVPDSSDLTSKQMVGMACYYHKQSLESQVQTFFASNDELAQVVANAQQKASSIPGNGEHYFSGSAIYYLSEDKECIADYSVACPTAIVGRKIAVAGGSIQVPLHQDFYENVLIFGANKDEQAMGVALNTVASLFYSYRSREELCNIKVIDCLVAQNKAYKNVLTRWQEMGVCEIIPRAESGQLLLELAEAIQGGHASPTILAILCSDKFVEMKRKMSLQKQTDSWDMDFDTEEISMDMSELSDLMSEGKETNVQDMTYPQALQYILEEGPMQGVHVILQVDKPGNILFEGDYCEDIVNKFKHRIILKSENQLLPPLRFSHDMDVESLSDDAEHLRAYYYSDGEEPVLFTPYQMPNGN